MLCNIARTVGVFHVLQPLATIHPFYTPGVPPPPLFRPPLPPRPPLPMLEAGSHNFCFGAFGAKRI